MFCKITYKTSSSFAIIFPFNWQCKYYLCDRLWIKNLTFAYVEAYTITENYKIPIYVPNMFTLFTYITKRGGRARNVDNWPAFSHI